MTEASHLTLTRTAYDTVAADYARLVPPSFEDDLHGRAMIGTFAELVRAGGPVADLACGPGHVTAHLHALGLAAFGVDLSPQMVAVARRSYPDLRFEEGSVTGLALADGSLGGALAWYSTVHTPPELLPEVFTEVHRVLAPGGRLLIAFKAGEQHRHLAHAYGHDLSLEVYWVAADRFAALLGRAGFEVEARLVCEPGPGQLSQQGYFLARRPDGPSGLSGPAAG
ncbi:class I SAM-dependent methyltransferase [Kitasatospora sp. NPDC002227]|uniref:class I SAM-dependent DNA methyltransferase n=1 Tax=Kitasatospora sp. NPDC002227 TaxID=3154773 RepID=UPI003316E3F2